MDNILDRCNSLGQMYGNANVIVNNTYQYDAPVYLRMQMVQFLLVFQEIGEENIRLLSKVQRDLYKEFKGDVDSLFQYLVEKDESFFLEIHKICTRYQMERLWISDVANVFYNGPRGSFWMHSSGELDGDFYGKIASHNKEFIRTVMSALKKLKGYEISDWD